MDLSERQYAPGWRPEPGDQIVGEIIAVDTIDGRNGRYQCITLRTEDGDLAVHAFHKVLAAELDRLRPKVGDTLGVAYYGKEERGERSYHKWRAAVEPR